MRFAKSLLILSLSLTAFGAGCSAVPPVAKSVDQAPTIQHQTDTSWKELDTGIARREYLLPGSAARLVLYRFAPNTVDISFEQATSIGDIANWRTTNPDALLILNGTYFSEDAWPSGFMQIEGKRIGTRSFDLDKSAMFVGGQHPRLVDTAKQAEPSQEKMILQSYPMLMKSGMAAVNADSGKRARRSIVGFDAAQNLYLGVVSDGDISLFALAQALDGLDIEWQDVLNLDGGPSTGISTKIGEYEELKNSWTTIPNVILVRKK